MIVFVLYLTTVTEFLRIRFTISLLQLYFLLIITITNYNYFLKSHFLFIFLCNYCNYFS